MQQEFSDHPSAPARPEWLTGVVQVAQDALVVLEPTTTGGSPDFVCRWANAAAAALIGRDLAEMVGRRFLEVIPGGGQLYEVLLAVRATRRECDGELDVRPLVAPVTRMSYRATWHAGCVVLSVADRTRTRVVEERAKSLEDLVVSGAALSTVSAGVLRPVLDEAGAVVDWRVEYLNASGAGLLGASDDGAAGRTILALVNRSGGEPGGFVDRVAIAWRDREAAAFELDVSAVGIGAKWLRCHVTPLDDVVVVHVDDVSASRAEEAALRASEQRYRSLFETANEAIALTDLDARIIAANPALGEMVGVAHGALVGESILRFLDASEMDQTLVDARELILGLRVTQRRAVRMARHDGQGLWAFVATHAVRDEVGRATGFLLMAVDIDDRERAARALRVSEARYRAIVEHADMLIARTDLRGVVEFANDRLAALLAVPAEEVIGRPAIEFHPDHHAAVEREVRAVREGRRTSLGGQFTVLTADGREVPTIGSAVGLYGEDGAFEGAVIVGSDITRTVEQDNARRELAAALAVAEQRERDRIASDLHDGPVQQLSALSIAFGAATMAERIEPGFLRSGEALLTETIAQLRSLLFQLAPPDFSQHRIGSALLLRAQRILPAGTHIELDDLVVGVIDEDTGRALFRIGQEALTNIAKHAHARAVRIVLSEDPIGVILEIIDDGIGAEPTRFTRHALGHLGVSGMIERARQLGGRCAIDSAPGSGTTVRVQLPRLDV